MKRTCDNCYNYCLSGSLIKMYHCLEAESNLDVEKAFVENGKNCPVWHEKARISVIGKYKRFF